MIDVDNLDVVGRPAAGVRSFHNATMFRTDARGERGVVCGLRNVDALVPVTEVDPDVVYERVSVVLVNVRVPVFACVGLNVLERAADVCVPGLKYEPLPARDSAAPGVTARSLDSVFFGGNGGGDKRLDMVGFVSVYDIVDPSLDFVGDEERELKPKLVCP